MTVIIRSFLYQITLSDHESYAIYTVDYDCDAEGNIVPSGLDTYEFGDLIIQTSSMRFTIKKTYCAYDYCVGILEEIRERYLDPVIIIDMEKLNKNWPYHAGELIVEPLK